ncbi:hypothetical protein [Armatimonas sp.]|uniref:hypothetical protein n=1 Tax=Armatimonas sp. TaxID=1872638 RepID=UPI00374CA84C
MSIVLELTPAEEEALSRGAERAGMDMPSFITKTARRAMQREFDDWERWESAGNQATTDACDSLIGQGIGFVYGRDGKVYRRTAEGEEELSA